MSWKFVGRACQTKTRYETKADAKAHAKPGIKANRCVWCDGYHLSSQQNGYRRKT